MRKRSEALASILLSQYNGDWREKQALPWGAVYALERIFGVSRESKWKSVAEAVRAVAQTEQPCPHATYDMGKHEIIVHDSGMLVRVVKLMELEPKESDA